MNRDIVQLMRFMQEHCFKVTSLSKGTKYQNCNGSKTQEWELTCQLNDFIMNHGLNLKAVLSCDEHATGIKWNPEFDSKEGDIFIYKTKEGYIVGSPLMYIDVKIAFVSDYKFVFSTITRRSFNNFANKEKHYYWVFNYTGERSILIDGLMFYKIVNNNNPWNVSKKPGCQNDRNEDYIMGTWIHGYRRYFEVHI